VQAKNRGEIEVFAVDGARDEHALVTRLRRSAGRTMTRSGQVKVLLESRAMTPPTLPSPRSADAERSGLWPRVTKNGSDAG
jgi:hypothetical protein